MSETHVVELDVEVGAGIVTNPDDGTDHPAVSVKVQDACLSVKFFMHAQGARELAAELIEKANRAELLLLEEEEPPSKEDLS